MGLLHVLLVIIATAWVFGRERFAHLHEDVQRYIFPETRPFSALQLRRLGWSYALAGVALAVFVLASLLLQL